MDCDVSNLGSGFLYWKVVVTKQIILNSNIVSTLSKESSSSLSSVCINTSPTPPILVYPSNGTILERCNVSLSLSWDSLPMTFGTDCNSTSNFGIKIYIGKNPLEPNDKIIDVLWTQSETDPFSTVTGLDSKTIYYWIVEVYNSNYKVRTEPFIFVTPDTSITACSGHGTCNNFGTCDCSSLYQGDNCEGLKPTQPTNSTNSGENLNNNSSKDNTGGIIGGVIGGLAFLCLLVLIGLFLLKRKTDKEREKMLEKPQREPPDFVPLAFNPPIGYPPLSPEKIVPWYSFEFLLLSNNFFLLNAILDITQSTEIDDVVKCATYVAESHRQGLFFLFLFFIYFFIFFFFFIFIFFFFRFLFFYFLFFSFFFFLFFSFLLFISFIHSFIFPFLN